MAGSIPIVNNASAEIISGLATRFGSIDYTQFQSVRWTFYSYVTYPEAGATTLNFFGTTPGTPNITLEDTNIPRTGSFGQQHFLVKSISTGVKIASNNLSGYDGSDASTLFSDYLLGFFNAGVLNFSIGARPFLQLPKPFQYAPQGAGAYRARNAGLTSMVGTGGPPTALSAMVSDTPFVQQTRYRRNALILDPNILIEAEQQFAISIDYPSGLVPVIGTGITDDTTNPLKVGVFLEGVLLRPLQ